MWTERTEMLLGPKGLGKLRDACVAVVGIGGVGSAAAEMLVRSGLGHIVVIDNDAVSETNINRQLLALHSTLGLDKCEVIKARLKDINPDLEIDCVTEYLCEDNVSRILGTFKPDFLVDAIDTLSPKIALIQYCLASGIPMVSSMGSGAKFDATAVRVADISRTRRCPLARMLRKRLHHLGIESGFLTVYSEEEPHRESVVIEESRNKKSQVGTISYLPTVFGCICSQVAIGHIIE